MEEGRLVAWGLLGYSSEDGGAVTLEQEGGKKYRGCPRYTRFPTAKQPQHRRSRGTREQLDY